MSQLESKPDNLNDCRCFFAIPRHPKAKIPSAICMPALRDQVDLAGLADAVVFRIGPISARGATATGHRHITAKISEKIQDGLKPGSKRAVRFVGMMLVDAEWPRRMPD